MISICPSKNSSGSWLVNFRPLIVLALLSVFGLVGGPARPWLAVSEQPTLYLAYMCTDNSLVRIVLGVDGSGARSVLADEEVLERPVFFDVRGLELGHVDMIELHKLTDLAM